MKKYVVCFGKKINSIRFADLITHLSKKHGIRQTKLAKAITELNQETKPLSPSGARQYINRIMHYKACPSSLRAESIISYISKECEVSIEDLLKLSVDDSLYKDSINESLSELKDIFKKSADLELMARVVSYARFLYTGGERIN